MSNHDINGCWHKYDNSPCPMFLLIQWLIKLAFINKNDPNEPVYIYKFQHSTVYIQTFFISIMPFCHTLFILFVNSFIPHVNFPPEYRELLMLIKFYIT